MSQPSAPWRVGGGSVAHGAASGGGESYHARALLRPQVVRQDGRKSLEKMAIAQEIGVVLGARRRV